MVTGTIAESLAWGLERYGKDGVRSAAIRDVEAE